MTTKMKIQQQPSVIPLYRRLCHWGPITAISIIGLITTATLMCDFLWWPPLTSALALANLLVFLTWNYLTLSNLLTAASLGPGYVLIGWEPENAADKQHLQFCPTCSAYKVPRSHHCRKCNRCVMKMDHHCPWINNCAGHTNQPYFIKFLFFAVFGCLHAVLILIPSIYRAIFRVWYLYYGTGREPIVNLGLYSVLFAIFACGLAIGVVVAVGFLFVVQMRMVLRNRTGIEDWIVIKAMHRPREDVFIYPYNLGKKRNFLEVFTWSGLPNGNGIVWPVVDGCDQFTLTIEQLKQKEEKRQHIVEYEAVENYSGRFFPITKGVKVCCCLPFNDEPRLPLHIGDRVLVSRWKRHWLYGEKILPDAQASNEVTSAGDRVASGTMQNGKSEKTVSSREYRGWFPRRCVAEMEGDNPCDLPEVDEERRKDD